MWWSCSLYETTLKCTNICLGVDDKRVESLWAQIKEQINKGDTAVGAYYRQPDQVEEDASCRQLEAASKSQAEVLKRDFIYPPMCWRSNTAEYG